MPGPKQPAWIQYSLDRRADSVRASRVPYRQSSAATLSQDLLKRILEHATSSLSLDRQQVDILTPFGRVCRNWRRAAVHLRVLRISNRGRREHWTPGPEVLQAASKATRLSLDIVIADRPGIPLHLETERLVKLVLRRCDRLSQLRLNTASLAVDVFGPLRLPDLTRLELYSSTPSLCQVVRHERAGNSSLRTVVPVEARPREVFIESCVSDAFVSRLSRLGIFKDTTRLVVTIRANRLVLEDLSFASFGSVVLDNLELRFDGPLCYDYHPSKFRERLFVGALRLRPKRLVIVLGNDDTGVLVELANVVSSAAPALVPTLSVKGLASARARGSRAQIDILELRAGRHVNGRAIETIVKGAGAPPNLYRVVKVATR